MNAIRDAEDDSVCKEAISNINEESLSLEKRGSMLSLEQAKVFLTIRMERHQKETGYTIEAIGVIVGGVQVVSGLGIAAKATTFLGKLIGAHITLNGVDALTENAAKLLFGDREYVGFMKKGYMGVADFLGFDKKIGLIGYHSVDMATSLYGVFKLTLKPDARRLFKYIPEDYYRQINTISRTALTLKFIGAGNKIRIISGIMNEDN